MLYNGITAYHNVYEEAAVKELVELLKSKAGLDEAMANQVVEIVVEHLEKALPAPLNKEVDKLLSGQITDISQIAGIGKGGGGIGGLLSKLTGGRK